MANHERIQNSVPQSSVTNGPVSSEFVGRELELAYVKLFAPDGKIVGGFGDGGVDIETEEPGLPFFQVKNSVPGLKTHLGYYLKFMSGDPKYQKYSKFVPVALGDFGTHTRAEVAESMREYGGYIGIDIPNAAAILKGITQIRDEMYKKGGSQKMAA